MSSEHDSSADLQRSTSSSNAPSESQLDPHLSPHASEHLVKIYTRPLCGYCVMAKRLLQSRSISYEEVNTQGLPEVRSWLVEVTRQRTVPQIFIRGVSIGGYTELNALDRAGELTKLVSDP